MINQNSPLFIEWDNAVEAFKAAHEAFKKGEATKEDVQRAFDALGAVRDKID